MYMFHKLILKLAMTTQCFSTILITRAFQGKYYTRAWLNGDDGRMLTCGLTTFVL